MVEDKMNELSLYILDIVQNSINANSKLVTLVINENYLDKVLTLKVIDDGKGMSEEKLKRVEDPFYTTRTTRKVGLGIPLLKELALLCEGTFKIQSKENRGTSLECTFKIDNVDLPPFGDLVETLYTLIINDLGVDIIYQHYYNGKLFSFDTREIKELLGDVSLKDHTVKEWFEDYVTSSIQTIKSEE